ncbi:nucleoid-associated protein [Pseudomonas mandelii]|uniref:nucleoid-associated protein n=1 Tax=Pseudomonas mandelii TaxID=75612 RepID=UPI003F59978B
MLYLKAAAIAAISLGHGTEQPPAESAASIRTDFTGRADGLSISFEQHLLGSRIKFNEAGGTLTLCGLPRQLTDQLKRAAG